MAGSRRRLALAKGLSVTGLAAAVTVSGCTTDAPRSLGLSEPTETSAGQGGRTPWMDVTIDGCRIARDTSCPGVDLSGRNLIGAPLSGANLAGADLSGANLELAGLEGANLEGADLSYAILRLARIDGANLRGANLRCANLTGVNLRGVQREGADFTDTYFEEHRVGDC